MLSPNLKPKQWRFAFSSNEVLNVEAIMVGIKEADASSVLFHNKVLA